MGWSDTVGTSNGSTLNTDPRSKRSYRYSTVANRQEYQIGMTLELDSETYSSYIDGYYTALSPYVFPSLLLATDTTSAIEIQQGNGSGTVNRTRFIVNNGSLNIPYNMNGRAVSKATTFSGILADPGVRLPWTSTFASCKEIYEGGKSMGPGGYLVISSTGALTMTGCIMNPPNY